MLDLAVFLGGMAGALARAGLDRAFVWSGHGWPWSTFLANLLGTFLLGYFATRLQERLPASTYRRPFVATGLCGAVTTFSTFQVELVRLAREGEVALAGTYLVGSVGAGLVLVHLVTGLTRRARLR